jgi:hypothetical protein
MLARILAFCDFGNLQGYPEDMQPKILTQKHRFTAKFPHHTLNQSLAQFLGKAGRALLYAPGQHAPVFQSE